MIKNAILLLTLALAAASPPGAVAQSASCLQGWSFEDVTRSGPWPDVSGTPATISWHQPGHGDRTDVWARSPSGDLIHYFRLGAGAWLGENLTDKTPDPGGLRTDPVAVLGYQSVGTHTYYRHDVFAVNHNEELIHYWWSEEPPSGWHSENLTQTRGGPPVFGKPVVRNSYYHAGVWKLWQDVYSVNLSGDLVHYWWTFQGWRHDNVRAAANGLRLDAFVQPTVIDEDPTSPPTAQAYHHVFAVDLSGHLQHYWRDATTWYWENATQVGGIQVHPVMASPTAAVDYNGTLGGANRVRFSVIGHRATDLIRYWSWDLSGPWSAENVTRGFGFLGTPAALVGKPALIRSFQPAPESYHPPVYERHDVWARDENKHLIHYWAADPWQSFKASGGVIPWRPGEDLTALIDGVFIESDPQATIRYVVTPATEPVHYVFGRSADSLVSYCWNRREGWSSATLQPISSPTGDSIAFDPALDDQFGTGIQLFAAGPEGHLLRFWK